MKKHPSSPLQFGWYNTVTSGFLTSKFGKWRSKCIQWWHLSPTSPKNVLHLEERQRFHLGDFTCNLLRSDICTQKPFGVLWLWSPWPLWVNSPRTVATTAGAREKQDQGGGTLSIGKMPKHYIHTMSTPHTHAVKHYRVWQNIFLWFLNLWFMYKWLSWGTFCLNVNCKWIFFVSAENVFNGQYFKPSYGVFYKHADSSFHYAKYMYVSERPTGTCPLLAAELRAAPGWTRPHWQAVHHSLCASGAMISVQTEE